MTSFSLLLWIALGIALQVGLFLAISFWQHWQSYTRLKQNASQVVVPSSAAHPLPDEAAGWPGFRGFQVARRIMEDAAGQIGRAHV